MHFHIQTNILPKGSYGILSIMLVFTLFSCRQDTMTGNLQDVRATEIKPWVRYAQQLGSIDTVNGQQKVRDLFVKFPVFSDLYFYRIINDPYNPDSSAWNVFRLYRSSPLVKELEQAVADQLNDISEQEKSYSNAFERLSRLGYKVYVPSVYTCITEMGTAAFMASDSVLGVSLDMYLGQGTRYYDTETWPMYIQRTMNKDNIVPNLLKSYIRYNILPQRQPRTFLDHAIDQGKEAYLLSNLLEAGQDTLCFDYSAEQLRFCRENEREIWAYLIDQKVIYSNDFRKYQKYVEPSPNAPGMPEGAPGRIAAFVGYNIISQYMERHPDTHIPDLMKEADSQKILESARYKP